jgi:hypothetical protein
LVKKCYKFIAFRVYHILMRGERVCSHSIGGGVRCVVGETEIV